MGFISDSARRAAKSANRPWQRAYIPEWFPAAQWVLATAIALYLVFQALAGLSNTDDSRPVTGITDTVSNPAFPVDALVDGTSGTPSTDLPTTQAGDDVVIDVETFGGGIQAVPQAAVDTALGAALGLTTGNWGVTRVNGDVPSGAPYPAAQVGAVTLLGDDGVQLTFLVQIDEQGDGAYDRTLQVGVGRDAGGWVFLTGV